MYYAYYRCSTETQMERNGLQMQEEVISRYAESHGVEIRDSFCDKGISGTTYERDGLLDLLTTVESGDRIVVQNTSRLWRDDITKVMIQKELRTKGVDVVSVEQPNYTINSKDPNDFFVNSLMELLDQYERLTIAMKLAKGRRAKANTGKKPCGVCPLGYRWEDGEIVIDYNNNLIVKDIFIAYTEMKSLQKVKEYCEERGYKSSRGKEIGKSSIKTILNNDFYIGMVRYGAESKEGTHEPIIDKELFEKANKLLEQNH